MSTPQQKWIVLVLFVLIGYLAMKAVFLLAAFLSPVILACIALVFFYSWKYR